MIKKKPLIAATIFGLLVGGFILALLVRENFAREKLRQGRELVDRVARNVAQAREAGAKGDNDTAADLLSAALADLNAAGRTGTNLLYTSLLAELAEVKLAGDKEDPENLALTRDLLAEAWETAGDESPVGLKVLIARNRGILEIYDGKLEEGRRWFETVLELKPGEKVATKHLKTLERVSANSGNAGE